MDFHALSLLLARISLSEWLVFISQIPYEFSTLCYLQFGLDSNFAFLSRPIVIYLATLALPLLECYGPVNTGRDLHPGHGIPSPPILNSKSGWRAMHVPNPTTVPQNDEMYNAPQVIRIPRRIRPLKERPTASAKPVSFLSVEPRAFQEDHLPSTPQLNAIMDRAMGKVKSMVKELEHEKG